MRLLKKSLGILAFVLTMSVFCMPVLASTDWELHGDAYIENNECILVPSSRSDEGGLFKNIPIDTREGFSISFEHFSGDFSDRKVIGSRLVFANKPIVLGDYYHYGYWEYIYEDNADLVFYGVQFNNAGSINTITNSGTSYRTIDTGNALVCNGTWNNVFVTYENETLTVWFDDKKIIESTGVKMNEQMYLGFTAGNSYYGCAKQAVRNIHLQAINQNLIKFNPNKGKCETKEMYISNKTSTLLPTAVRKGYIFKGWYTKIKGGKKVNPLTYKFSQGQTLYAHWKYNQKTLRFKPNKGTVKKKSKKVVTGEKAGKLPVAKRKQYAFKGWYTKKKGGKKITKNTVIKKNMKLYAHWEKKKAVKFVIDGKVVRTKYVKKGNKLGTLSTPSRSNRRFLGWFTKKSGGKQITSETKIKKNITYYAHWERVTTTNNNTSGGGSSDDDWWDDRDNNNNNNDRCIICGNDGEVNCGTCGGRGGKYEYTSTPNYSGSLSGSNSSSRWVDCWRCNGSGEMDCYYCDN